jgi:serine/threonine protein kinase
MSFENFTIAYLIGSGHFSQVFLGCVKGTLKNKNVKLYAIKQMKKSVIHTKKLVGNILL